MQPSEHRAAKAIAIAEMAIKHAAMIGKLLPQAYPRKRPRICMRAYAYTRAYRRKQKQKLYHARTMLFINTGISYAQMAMIISQPIPKFPIGRNETAIIGEQIKEEIIINHAAKT